MYEVFASLTVIGMGAIFGVALAALIIVHPLLTSVSRATAIEAFKPFFYRTHFTVLISTGVVTLLALITSIISGNWWWLSVALIMHLNGPYAYFRMMPTNRRLLAEELDIDSEETGKDLIRWGGLHAVRVLINGVVFVGFVLLAIYH